MATFSSHSAFLIVCILLFSVGLTLANSASKVYWTANLPNTPMPKAIIDALSLEGNGDVWLATHNKAHHWTHSYEVMLDPYEGVAGKCHPELMKETDFTTSRYFLAKDLSIDSKLTVHFTNGGIHTRFPSPSLAQKMPPLTTENLNQNLHFFNAEPKSGAAMFMSQTVARCDHPNQMDGKSQYCATSLEKLVSYVTSTLGGSSDVKTATASTIGSKADALLPYKVSSFRQLAREDYMVTCHRSGFPYAVYYCHQPNGVSLYSVSLIGVKDGAKVEANAVCHSQTSEWSPEFVGFKALGVKPGTHICHFLQFHDIVWYRG